MFNYTELLDSKSFEKMAKTIYVKDMLILQQY